MLYVVALIAPPLALSLARGRNYPDFVDVCYCLTLTGLAGAMFPGLVVVFSPFFLLWFGAFWVPPAVYAIGALRAHRAGRTPGDLDYLFGMGFVVGAFGLSIAGLAVFVVVLRLRATFELRDEITRWASEPEHRARWEDAVIDGFPETRLRLGGFAFTATGPVAYAFRAPVLTVESPGWPGSTLHLAAPKGATVELADVATALDLDTLDVTARFKEHETTFAYQTKGAISVGPARRLVADDLHGQLSISAQDDYFHIFVYLDRVKLPQPVPPLGDTVIDGDFSATFQRPWRSGPLREALPRWRDEGGFISDMRGSLQWDGLEIYAYGHRLTLDEALRPSGTFNMSIGNAATIDALVAAGRLSPEAGDAAKVSGTQHGDNASIENGRVMLGTTPIVDIPPVSWP